MAHEQVHNREGGCSCSTQQHEHGGAQTECGCGHEHAGIETNKDVVRLIVGIAIFAAGVVISNVFEPAPGVELAIFLAAYLTLGFDVLKTAVKNIARGKVFDENFLMTVATVGAFILGDFIEGTAVMLFYLVGETLSEMAAAKSRRSITKLMDIRPDYANIELDGQTVRVAPEEVTVGDTIVVKPFEKVPLDGVVLEGSSAMSTSALTGESVPRDVEAGGEVLSGFVNGSGLVKVRVTKAFGESTVSKILEIVEHANSTKAPTEKFITKFARYYTPIVCAAALVVGVVPSIVTGDISTWVYRALLFLVISCPCALVVSVPLTYFGGIGGASRKGILVKGAGYMEALTDISAVVFDKTGTLTKGEFEVSEVIPAAGRTQEEVLRAAAAVESNSSHPIARSVMKAYGGGVDELSISDYQDIPAHGVSATVDGEQILAGNARLMEKYGVAHQPCGSIGTVLYVARGGEYIGCVVAADVVKPDAAKTVAELKKMDVRPVMLTGDVEGIARHVADETGIGEVYFELLPEDKYKLVEKIKLEDEKVLFAGDGINDAPALARADVGVAMGALGSDAAIEAADVVLMTDELSKIPDSIRIAKKTRRIVVQNIVFAIAVKCLVMVLGVTGLADMWAAVFADVGVTLIAVLNALRALRA